MFHKIPKEVREQILSRVREGREKVADLANQHGISAKTIYGWLSSGIDGSNSQWLENNRLKKENTQLKQMIGELMLEKKREKKQK